MAIFNSYVKLLEGNDQKKSQTVEHELMFETCD